MKLVQEVKKKHGKASLPSREAWIEITEGWHEYAADKSLPLREAWIEITDDEEYMHLIIILIVMA